MSVIPRHETSNDHAVVATVAYADVFDMPLELAHVHRYLVHRELDRAEVTQVADALVKKGQLERTGDLLTLPGRSEVLDVHRERSSRATAMWVDAEKWGRRIGGLPFVRMVAVTGGLAVDSVAAHDDIDYFIVVRPGRLWLTRAMILLLARFAARKGLDLCPNFIVSDSAIEMRPRTVYVARELAQMKVIVGEELCTQVRRANRWMFDFLPNATIEGDTTRALATDLSRAKVVAETLLLTAPFELLENWEMNRKVAMLTQVHSRRPEVGAPDESSFSRDVCKGHMVGNSAGIDVAWKKRLRNG